MRQWTTKHDLKPQVTAGARAQLDEALAKELAEMNARRREAAEERERTRGRSATPSARRTPGKEGSGEMSPDARFRTPGGGTGGGDGRGFGGEVLHRSTAWRTPVKGVAQRGEDGDVSQTQAGAEAAAGGGGEGSESKLVGKLAVPVGPVRGATDDAESPQGTARSSWASARSHVSGISEMFAEWESNEKVLGSSTRLVEGLGFGVEG